MFEVSEEALDKVKQFLKSTEERKPIRILALERDWKIPSLVMALDEEKDDDEVFNKDGVTFLVRKTLFEKAKPIRISYTHSTLGAGYVLKSAFSDAMEGLDEMTFNSIYSDCNNTKE